ncbi:Histone-lysine N-methyltransferase ASHR3 [Platanthera zijinensis]|uniref:Histone-lysine N-methyltransferase ASHR3 n=1 Tax=Platanthera zijinensis TaxID=2320716 RepID=A0AAP0GE97_9ASPA
MPDLSNLLTSPSHLEIACSSSHSSLFHAGSQQSPHVLSSVGCEWKQRLRFPISTHSVSRKGRRGGSRRAASGNPLEEHVQAWAKIKIAAGVLEKECVLPFLTNGPKTVKSSFLSSPASFLSSIDL